MEKFWHKWVLGLLCSFSITHISTAQSAWASSSQPSSSESAIVRPRTQKDIEFLNALTSQRETGDERQVDDKDSSRSVPVIKVDRGQPCLVRAYFDTVDNDTEAYWKCSQQSKAWGTAGSWTMERCAHGMHFVKREQRCEERQSKRRQTLCPQGNCPIQQNYCPQARIGLTGSTAVNTPCDWQTERLQPDPFSPAYFLQCVPIHHGALCGKFIRMRCAVQTTFSMPMQVCLLAVASVGSTNICGSVGGQAICACASQNPQCPSGCSCMQNTCCAGVNVHPPRIVHPPPQVVIRPPQCPGGGYGTGQCGQCGSGYMCMEQTCCPSPPTICPDGSPARGPCNAGRCALGSVCLNGHACCPVPLPICPSGVPAIAPCNGPGSCPSDTNLFCYPDAEGRQGCCPLPQCPTGGFAIAPCNRNRACPPNTLCLGEGCCPLPVCASSGQPAVGMCGSNSLGCPPGSACEAGACCPLPLCPDGTPVRGPCQSGQCGPAGICIGGGCCALPQCPNGQNAVGLCAPGVTGGCPRGSICSVTGGCCPLPQCPDGTPGELTCGSHEQCGSLGQCVGGVCCAAPRCPDGSFSQQACQGVCPQFTACHEGQCCPLPVVICPNGRPANGQCSGSGQCVYGFDCYQGGCCEVARCPAGELSQGACTPSSPCPQGLGCIDGACCPIQMCPDNQYPIQPCGVQVSTQCPSGYNCMTGSCCQQPQQQIISPGIPTCLDGARPIIGSCSTCTQPGYSCRQGACCPVGGQYQQPHQPVVAPLAPYVSSVQQTIVNQQTYSIVQDPQQYGGFICPNGHQPLSPCSYNGQCNAPGLICIDGQCCPQLVQLCPQGQQASQICSPRQSSCQTGFTCHQGGCCPQIVTQLEQQSQLQCRIAQEVPVCYCAAYNNACPDTTSCQAGLCCASANSPLYNTVRPGDRCQSTDQCPGLQGVCLNGHCACVGTSRSNGVQCVEWYAAKHKKNKLTTQLRRYKPGVTCGQFAANCSTLLTSEHRPSRQDEGRNVQSPGEQMNALGIGESESPLYYYTFRRATHFCNGDNDCTPDMTCVHRQCLAYMTVSERGCTTDEQCSRTVLSSYCHQETGSSSCECLPGRFAVDGRDGTIECVSTCPRGTHSSNGRCVIGERPSAVSSAFATATNHSSPTSKLQRLTGQLAHLFSDAATSGKTRSNRNSPPERRG